MKPQGRGVLLETLGEIHTAADALEFIPRLPGLSDGLRTEFVNFAVAVRDLCTVMDRTVADHARITRDGEPATDLHIADHVESKMLLGAFELTAQFHPDELVRQSAGDALHSYQQSVLEGALGNPTSEA